MVPGQKNSYINFTLGLLDSEDNKKYSQTSAHTEVLEAIFPKQENREQKP